MPRKPSEKTTTAKATAVPPKAIAASPQPVKVELKPAAVAEKVEAAPVNSTRPAEIAKAIADLQNADADVARDAATSLARFKESAAIEPLIEVLGNRCGYYHSVVRAAAAESLGLLGDKRAIEPLLAALTDQVAEVSSESIRALATLGDARAVEALSDVIENRAGYFLPLARHAAVLGLAKLGGPQAIKILSTVESNPLEDTAIRTAAHARSVSK